MYEAAATTSAPSSYARLCLCAPSSRCQAQRQEFARPDPRVAAVLHTELVVFLVHLTTISITSTTHVHEHNHPPPLGAWAPPWSMTGRPGTSHDHISDKQLSKKA
jgi:hypothetical protein